MLAREAGDLCGLVDWHRTWDRVVAGEVLEPTHQLEALLLDVNVQSVARWEKGQKLPGPADRLIRGIYLEHAEDKETPLRELLKILSGLDDLDRLELAHDDGWRRAA